MTNISHDLTGKIDAGTIAILSTIDRIAAELKLDFFVVGAFARDIILEHVNDIHTTRATLDIDIAVSVENWNQFQKLKGALVATGKFVSTNQSQRLMYEDDLPVDIIPFGRIGSDNDSIKWPPEYEIEMSTAGYKECYENAVSVQLKHDPEMVVKVVNLAGLAAMKIISWDENPERRGKDSADLFLVMRNYLDAGNTERFFDTDSDILEKENNDYDRASGRFLGREIERMVTPATRTKLIDILDRQARAPQGHPVAMDVMRQIGFRKLSYDKVVQSFNALLKGLSDG